MGSKFQRRASHLALCVAALLSTTAAADDAQQRLIDAGREQFVRVRQLTTKAATRTHTVDRLFNARSCAECHKLGGIGGAGGNEHNVQLFNITPGVRGAVVRESVFPVFQEPGSRFAPIATDGIVVLPRLGSSPDHAARRLELLRKIDPYLPEVIAATPVRTEPDIFVCGVRGRAEPDTGSVEERNTPPLFGLGRIEAIPQDVIDALAASQPKEIRGRAPRLKTGGVGRFGWKSQTATLADFNEGACAVELGLKTAKFAPGEYVRFRSRKPGLPAPIDSASSEVDMTTEELAALNAFTASLPEPVQVVHWSEERDVRQGEIAFRNSGCAACHVPNVGDVVGLYSDLLLHDVGTAGAIIYYGSRRVPTQPSFDVVDNLEIRTPPLWGVADSAPYLHDGSAKDLESAIRAHQSQAADSVKYYDETLNAEERSQLLKFLGSLRAPPIDATIDRAVSALK